MLRRIGLSLFMIAILLILAANVYIWRIQQGVYEYSIAIYFVGVMTPVGVIGVLMFMSKVDKLINKE